MLDMSITIEIKDRFDYDESAEKSFLLISKGMGKMNKGVMKMTVNERLTQNLIWTGVQDAQLKVFDIIMETEFGTTYNSYLLKGTEKTALIETVKLPFFDEFQQKIEKVVPLCDIDYLIVNHTEPDHAGSIEKCLAINPNLTVIGSPAALQFLKEIVNRDFKALAVKEGQTLDLGGKTLQFMIVPNLHWPDTMYTWVQEDGILFTCDSFGAHYAFEGLRLSEVQDHNGYERALKYYYDHILKPFRPFMQKALDKVEPLKLNMICPGHGPILDCRLPEMFAQYRKWNAEPQLENKLILAYVSAYGYTEQLAQAAARGIESVGWQAELVELTQTPVAEVVEKIENARGFLLGSPTILAEALPPVWAVLSLMNPVIHGGKYAAVFGSYGWSGEAFAHLEERLKQLRIRVMPAFKVRFKPSPKQLEEAEAVGRQWVEIIQNQ